MMGVRELSCSLKRSNPSVPLIILSGEGDQLQDYEAELQELGERRVMRDLSIPNSRDARYSRNWIKLKLWLWEDFDALVVIDADAIVLGDLTHLFQLPTDFAWATHNGRDGYEWARGGLLMIRPCSKTLNSMLQLLHAHKQLLFEKAFAEQDFLTWYFRYTAYELPVRYNLHFHFVDESGREPGGRKALVLHFAEDHKDDLLNSNPNSWYWKFLCYQPKLASLNSSGLN